MSATGPPSGPAGAEVSFSGKPAYVLSQLSYYLIAIVGVGFVIGGTIAALIALRQLAWPDPGSVTRASTRSLLHGLAFAVPGAVAAWWHLGQAREREGHVVPGASWGRSLYFHTVAFIAFIVALAGTAVTLFALVDAALPPRCPTFAPMACTDSKHPLRVTMNGLIVVVVAGSVWWWHLREGRDTVSP